MTGDMHEDHLTPVATPASLSNKQKRAGREARRKRVKARRQGEEIIAWFVVPVILIGLYWGITSALDFFGTTPGQVWDQAMQVKAALDKKTR